MAKVKYFSDTAAEAIEFDRVSAMPNEAFAAAFPGVVGRSYDSYARLVGRTLDGRVLPITRSIEYKSNPSKHVCNDRCVNAQGKTMRCECQCGGKNHGRGRFICE